MLVTLMVSQTMAGSQCGLCMSPSTERLLRIPGGYP
jgi:hypothetical protein